MSDQRMRVRASRITGELELEGSPATVAEWWEKLWPAMGATVPNGHKVTAHPMSGNGTQLGVPEVFGEFFAQFRSDITDVDKMLVAAAFVHESDPDKTFTTKAAKDLLLEQNIKVANPSECVRRLTSTRRAFVVSNGRFRVSATGFESLKSLRNTVEGAGV